MCGMILLLVLLMMIGVWMFTGTSATGPQNLFYLSALTRPGLRSVNLEKSEELNQIFEADSDSGVVSQTYHGTPNQGENLEMDGVTTSVATQPPEECEELGLCYPASGQDLGIPTDHENTQGQEPSFGINVKHSGVVHGEQHKPGLIITEFSEEEKSDQDATNPLQDMVILDKFHRKVIKGTINEAIEENVPHILTSVTEMMNEQDNLDYMEDFNEVTANEIDTLTIDKSVNSQNAAETNDTKDDETPNLKPIILHIIYLDCQKSFGKDDILMAEYIQMYRHFIYFLSTFGSFASVQTKMLESRLQELEVYVKEADKMEYQTLTGMIRFEDMNEIIQSTSPFSGSMLFTCLHRHLQFLTQALFNTLFVDPNASLLEPFSQAYHSLLAPHHSWIVKNFYLMGMQFLGTKGDAMESFLDSQGESNMSDQLLDSELRIVLQELGEVTKMSESILVRTDAIHKVIKQVIA